MWALHFPVFLSLSLQNFFSSHWFCNPDFKGSNFWLFRTFNSPLCADGAMAETAFLVPFNLNVYMWDRQNNYTKSAGWIFYLVLKCSDKEHYSLKLNLLGGKFMHIFAANQPGSLSELNVLGSETCIGFALWCVYSLNRQWCFCPLISNTCWESER